MYRVGQRQNNKRRNKHIWPIIIIIFVTAIAAAAIYFIRQMQPTTTIDQGKAVSTRFVAEEKIVTKKYDQANFSISLPLDWKPQPRPSGPYNMYIWKVINKHKNSEEITVYEDTIPTTFPVNKIIILEPQSNRFNIKGSVSDNCETYTKNDGKVVGPKATSAKWQGVDFICDQGNTLRNVVGTSSTDGINTVILKSPSSGTTHKYFFTYENNSISASYNTFIDALSSFEMK